MKNVFFNTLAEWFGLSLYLFLGWLGAPLAWLMGVPWSDAPEIGTLLERSPGLQVLATSRQALRIRGEHEVAIEP